MHMSESTHKDSRHQPLDIGVETWLQQEKSELEAKGLLISERIVIDRLLKRSLELKDAYGELSEGMEPLQWQAYLGVVLFTAAFWNPDETQKMREAERRLIAINERVSMLSVELAELLEERTQLCEEYSFDADDAYHICDLIDRAFKQSGHYELHLKPKLEQLRYQYDLKYWPKVADLIREIGHDASLSEVTTIMEITQEAIRSRVSSRRDYVRALFAALNERQGPTFRDIPAGFNLTDGSLSILVSCALDLPEEKMIDAGYLKRLRQTERAQWGDQSFM